MPTWPRAPSTRRDRPPLRPPPPPLPPLLPGVATLVLGGEAARPRVFLGAAKPASLLAAKPPGRAVFSARRGRGVCVQRHVDSTTAPLSA